jgi:hypothetical protein
MFPEEKVLKIVEQEPALAPVSRKSEGAIGKHKKSIDAVATN